VREGLDKNGGGFEKPATNNPGLMSDIFFRKLKNESYYDVKYRVLIKKNA